MKTAVFKTLVQQTKIDLQNPRYKTDLAYYREYRVWAEGLNDLTPKQAVELAAIFNQYENKG